MIKNSDTYWIKKALLQAHHALAQDEVPVGSILVLEDQIIGEGFNCPISMQDSSAHAEIMALRSASKKIGNYRLLNTTLYVTLEPCLMCVGAMVQARIQRLVFGACDPKAGAAGSRLNVLAFPWLNHRIEVTGGVEAETCGNVLTQFFREKRQCKKLLD